MALPVGRQGFTPIGQRVVRLGLGHAVWAGFVDSHLHLFKLEGHLPPMDFETKVAFVAPPRHAPTVPDFHTEPLVNEKTIEKGVRFVREVRTEFGPITMVYRIYEGPDAVSAKSFLDEHPVTQTFLYLVVETPEGTFCRDIDGTYKE